MTVGSAIHICAQVCLFHPQSWSIGQNGAESCWGVGQKSDKESVRGRTKNRSDDLAPVPQSPCRSKPKKPIRAVRQRLVGIRHYPSKRGSMLPQIREIKERISRDQPKPIDSSTSAACERGRHTHLDRSAARPSASPACQRMIRMPNFELPLPWRRPHRPTKMHIGRP